MKTESSERIPDDRTLKTSPLEHHGSRNPKDRPARSFLCASPPTSDAPRRQQHPNDRTVSSSRPILIGEEGGGKRKERRGSLDDWEQQRGRRIGLGKRGIAKERGGREGKESNRDLGEN